VSFTDRGIAELEQRRGEQELTYGWPPGWPVTTSSLPRT